MSFDDNTPYDRRRILKLIGSSAALVPLAGLTACGGGESSSTTTAPAEKAMDKAEEKMDAAMDSAEEAMESAAEQVEEAASDMSDKASGDGLPLISEDDPQAKSLAYVHDATTVDSAKNPRYQSGQACSNCALYLGGDKPQGGCSIFPGKAVKATGWCSVYAPKA